MKRLFRPLPQEPQHSSRQPGRKLSCWVLVLLCLGAAGLTCVHLRPAPQRKSYALPRPQAATGSIAPLAPHQPSEMAVPVNRATVDELVTIPGIGPELAQAIISERDMHGMFYYPEDLLCVRGIGEKTLATLLPYISLE